MPNEPETEPVPVPCLICGQPVVLNLPPEGDMFRDAWERTARKNAVHDACQDRQRLKLESAKILEAENHKLSSWQAFCPDEFKKNLDPKFHGYNAANFNKVMGWRYGERGLRVSGQAGRCKTRFIWKLLEREWQAGRSMTAHTHAHFRQTVTALAASDQRQLLTFVASCAAPDILFLDDLGKGRSTPAAEEIMFDLLDSRMAHCRPTLFTYDMQLDAIEAQITQAYQQGFMRRVLEKTDLVEF